MIWCSWKLSRRLQHCPCNGGRFWILLTCVSKLMTLIQVLVGPRSPTLPVARLTSRGKFWRNWRGHRCFFENVDVSLHWYHTSILAGKKSCWNLATGLVWSLLCLLCQQPLEDLWHRWQFCFKILWTVVDSSDDNSSPSSSQNISAGEARITSGQRNALESANKSSYGFFIPHV